MYKKEKSHCRLRPEMTDVVIARVQEIVVVVATTGIVFAAPIVQIHEIVVAPIDRAREVDAEMTEIGQEIVTIDVHHREKGLLKTFKSNERNNFNSLVLENLCLDPLRLKNIYLGLIKLAGNQIITILRLTILRF